MEVISAFDMLKIGVGPSSSHTLGPWRAVQRWLGELSTEHADIEVERVSVHLYGSLALTGRGHCTDKAVCLALLRHDPETVPVHEIGTLIDTLAAQQRVPMPGDRWAAFTPFTDIHFHRDEQLPEHPNGMRCVAHVAGGSIESTYYSIGGGFILAEGESMHAPNRARPPYPSQTAADLRAHCEQTGLSIAALTRANEQAWAPREVIERGMLRIWEVMQQSVFDGCHTTGTLPGGLGLERRAAKMNRRLLGDTTHTDPKDWIDAIRARGADFREVMQWISCFALAVNEQNAALGRVVTAPTNGAAGVIPAVLMYHLCFATDAVDDDGIVDFLLVSGEIGALFKKGATISAALGGCQAEIGVSSAMAAAALCEARGGSVPQALAAAEIAMEHHLGMTCDPVGGLVQIPCIERNSMGAVKAINAAELASASNPADAKVSLDEVIRTMSEVARDMSLKYKETSQGGLATNISVRVPEC